MSAHRFPLFKVLFPLALALLATDAMAVRRVVHDPANIDRPGLDYQHFALQTPDPEACIGRCLVDSRCAAYTYVKPGVQGPQAVCWLKSRVPVAVRNNCCTSGTVKGVFSSLPTHPPKRIEPPDSPNQAFCSTTNTVCGDRKGKWNSDTNSCDCGEPVSPHAPPTPQAQ